jgi:hypothetical protein
MVFLKIKILLLILITVLFLTGCQAEKQTLQEQVKQSSPSGQQGGQEKQEELVKESSPSASPVPESQAPHRTFVELYKVSGYCETSHLSEVLAADNEMRVKVADYQTCLKVKNEAWEKESSQCFSSCPDKECQDKCAKEQSAKLKAYDAECYAPAKAAVENWQFLRSRYCIDKYWYETYGEK